jgi:hypothetical protein
LSVYIGIKMSDVYGDFLTTVGERFPSTNLTKDQFFDIVAAGSYIGRTVSIHNPVTKQEVSGRILGVKRVSLEAGTMQSLKRDAGVVIRINLADGKKLELSKNDGLYNDSFYTICSDERCSIMGGISRKRKTRGRRRKTKNNKKRKTYRKRR